VRSPSQSGATGIFPPVTEAVEITVPAAADGAERRIRARRASRIALRPRSQVVVPLSDGADPQRVP
jgi:hypothetical protein